MLIKFLGCHSAFGRTHNNAYFRAGDDLVLIDLSMLHFNDVRDLIESENAPCGNTVYIFLTHMHDDHFSGIPMFIHWCVYYANKRVVIITGDTLYDDVMTEFRIKGVKEGQFSLYTYAPGSNMPVRVEGETGHEVKIADILSDIIPTTHTPTLEDKCFGFRLYAGDDPFVYTGDTATLEPFIMALKSGDELYCEMAVHYGEVHLLWEEQKDTLFKLSLDHKIYLMHMDDEEALSKLIEGTSINLARLG